MATFLIFVLIPVFESMIKHEEEGKSSSEKNSIGAPSASPEFAGGGN